MGGMPKPSLEGLEDDSDEEEMPDLEDWFFFLLLFYNDMYAVLYVRSLEVYVIPCLVKKNL